MEKELSRAALCLAAVAALLALALMGRGAPAEAAAGTARVAAEDGTKYVALTFDDGPRADTTSVLLAGLDERDAKATFFLIGQQIEGNEELIEWMARSGHQIGNHTYSHQKLQGCDRDTLLQEINKTEVVLSHILGPGEYWLRPPYGLIDPAEKALVKTPMVHWSVDPEDWKVLDTDRVVEHVCSHVQDGDIILLHDFYPTSVEAALQIVDRLRGEGYEFVTVRELLTIKGTAAEAGKMYRNAWQER